MGAAYICYSTPRVTGVLEGIHPPPPFLEGFVLQFWFLSSWDTIKISYFLSQSPIRTEVASFGRKWLKMFDSAHWVSFFYIWYTAALSSWSQSLIFEIFSAAFSVVLSGTISSKYQAALLAVCYSTCLAVEGKMWHLCALVQNNELLRNSCYI